jgi:hypothetical protein
VPSAPPSGGAKDGVCEPALVNDEGVFTVIVTVSTGVNPLMTSDGDTHTSTVARDDRTAQGFAAGGRAYRHRRTVIVSDPEASASGSFDEARQTAFAFPGRDRRDQYQLACAVVTPVVFR